MMRGLILLAGLAAPLTAADALADRLFERLSKSAFVVKGKAVEFQPVRKRDWQVFEAPNGVRSQITQGLLWTIEIAECLCGRQEFLPGSAPTVAPPNPVSLYVPLPLGGQSSGVFPVLPGDPERISPGREYLLFLLPHEDQKRLTGEYEMDPSGTYYRTYGGYGGDGAYELPNATMSRGRAESAAGFLAAVTALCEAVRPERTPEKLIRLRTLRERTEPRWRHSVEAAIRALEGQEGRVGR